jgi:hypothetical protein
MSDNWMIEVLADLRNFAKNNSMAKLAEQLDDTIHIAASELAPQMGEMKGAECRSDEAGDVLQPAFVV